MRRQPYTERGIERVPCARCGAPARYQWQICALGDQYHAVCAPCDIGLNRAALEYIGWPDADQVVAAYLALKSGE